MGPIIPRIVWTSVTSVPKTIRPVCHIVVGVFPLSQGNGLNALAGVVSLCPAVTGTLFSVEAGNSRLSEVRSTSPLIVAT